VSAPVEGYFVARTVRALELLAFAPRTATQVAEHLRVHPRTARRLLDRLVDEQYLTRDHARYMLTTRLYALAAQALVHAELPTLAAPRLHHLHTRTHLASRLFIPSYDSVLCIAYHDDGAATAGHLGELVPCHCSAPGKALLAHRDRWLDDVLRHPLPAHTDRTITDPADLQAATAQIRETGYAVEDREHRSDTRAVAAVIHAPHQRAIAAVTVTATTPIDAAAIAHDVLNAAERITRELAAHAANRPTRDPAPRAHSERR
jgi:DNA-binding IclR family transcriptional regulator